MAQEGSVSVTSGKPLLQIGIKVGTLDKVLHREVSADLASVDSNLTLHICWSKYRDENTKPNSKDMG